jgi:hypothetical protein
MWGKKRVAFSSELKTVEKWKEEVKNGCTYIVQAWNYLLKESRNKEERMHMWGEGKQSKNHERCRGAKRGIHDVFIAQLF